MTRARLAALALAATLAAGCTTVSDNDVVARVNDAELSPSELSDQLTAAGQLESATGHFDAPQTRVQITQWIRLQVAEQTGLIDRYAGGDDPLPVACVLAIPAADRAAADSLVSQLTSPDVWDEIAASMGVDLAPQRGQACAPLAAYPPELAEPLATLSVSGDPMVIETVEPAGVYVVRALTVDELDLQQLLQAANDADPLVLETFVNAFDEADIYIDPRFGYFDTAQFGVAALG